MPVAIETLDIYGLKSNDREKTVFHTSVPADGKEYGITYHKSTGKEPICVVKCSVDNTEANIYLIKPHSYIPIFATDGLVQLLVSDNPKDDFPMQRIATLTKRVRGYQLPVRKDGKMTGEWTHFFLEE